MLPFGFKSTEFADITLQLVPRERSHQEQVHTATHRDTPRSSAEAASPAVTVLSDFPAHCILLAAKSTWFKSQLGAWQHNTKEQVLQVQLDPDDVPAFEAMVAHMYEVMNSDRGSIHSSTIFTQQSQTQLVKLLALCDYYGYAAGAADAASILQQAGVNDLSWEVVHLVFSTPDEVAKQYHMQGVCNLAQEKLHRTFGDLEAAMRNIELQRVWAMLPPGAVIAVLCHLETCVITEDTVLYAAGLWARKQAPQPAACITDMLYSAVHVPQLTAAAMEYLVPLCPGFWSYLMSHSHGARLLALLKCPAYDRQLPADCTYNRLFVPRPVPQQPSVSIKLALTRRDIEQAEQQSQPNREHRWVNGVNVWESDSTFHAGFAWRMVVRMSAAQNLEILLQCRPPCEQQSLQTPPPSWPDRSTFCKPTFCAVHGLPRPVSSQVCWRQPDCDVVIWYAQRPQAGWQSLLVRDSLTLRVEFQGPVNCDGAPYRQDRTLAS